MIKTHTIETKVTAEGQAYKLVSHKRGVCCHPSLDCPSSYSVVKINTSNIDKEPTRAEIRKGWVYCDEDSSEAYSFFKTAGEPED